MNHLYFCEPKMASESDHFDVQRLHDKLQECLEDDSIITVDHYVSAYEEISKLLKLLGTVFSFVNSDVVEKVDILNDYRKSELREDYKTIQSMIKYEVATKTTNNKKKASGARTLLRLHRALEFVSDFIQLIEEAAADAKLSAICGKSYNRTLSKHHPWLVRKGVQIALYTLPTRVQFIEKLKAKDVSTLEAQFAEVASLGFKIFNIVEALYSEYDLHRLL